MEESTNGSEKSISMGPAELISRDEASNEPNNYTISDASFISPTRNQVDHVMGSLSLSSIAAGEISQVVNLHAAFSPDADFRPDILMSTVNSRQASTSQDDLSISMGPIPGFNFAHENQCDEYLNQQEQPLTSLVANIERLEVKRKIQQLPNPPVAVGSKSIQTEDLKCQKCEELHILYNRKLLEVANEFQQQYTSQFQMIEQHVVASDQAQKQIKDLTDQLDAADKQLKSNRAFLEQQAIEREQEREEANEQQKKLEYLLAEKEKECERIKVSTSQLSHDVQQLQTALKEKDQILQDHLAVQQRLEQQNQVLRNNQAEMDEENSSLQTVLDVKDQLLKAQSEQITALQNELENQMYAQSETERESDVPASHKADSTLQDVVDTSLPVTVGEMPSLFDELQQLIFRLLHKVDNSTRALEAAQATKQKRTNNNLLSPRTHITPSTSTEDISIKDRHPRDLDIRDTSPSPTNGENGQNDPERALNFLQQLDGKLAVLSRIEEAACKRIADLEAELQRISQSEKRSISRAAELEQQYQQHQLLLQDVDAEKHELQMEHTELLKRISSLENRLEEQRRSAALGASQNIHAEKCRALSEEKQQLYLIVQEKEESLTNMQKQMGELYERIEKLMKAIQEKEQEQESSRRIQDDFSHNSVERLRDAPHQDGSMTWSKLGAQNSPVHLSPIYQPQHQNHPAAQFKHQETIHALTSELGELKEKLKNSERERQVLEDEAACNASRLAQLESLELRNAALDDMIDETERQKDEFQTRCAHLEKEWEDCQKKLQELEIARERCVALEKELNQHKVMTQELEASRQSCTALKKEFADQKLASETAIDELQKHCKELEINLSNQRDLTQEYDIMRRRCLTLETEVAAQRGTITAVEVLQQRCASLQADLVYHQQTAQQQSSALKAQLDSKEKTLSDLQAKLKLSDSCKAKVEEALQNLQREVEAIKEAQQLQQKEKHVRTADPRDLSLEGQTAPPDLLAPSFVEFLGSTTSSRCSSRATSIRNGSPAHRTAEFSTFNDLSLPNSMMGKTALKEVQRESEQLLAFGKHMLEMQQNAAQQKISRLPATNQNVEDDLETTLKPDGDSFVVTINPVEVELTKKVQLFRTELAMERLLLQDQRTTNTRLQQQVMQLLAQQRNQPVKTQPPQKSISAYRSLPPEQASKFHQYRALKLESIRKNLVYQKKFLSAIVFEWNQNHNRRIENATEKPLRRFRVAVFAIISIERMRYIAKQWRQRRRAIEARPSTD